VRGRYSEAYIHERAFGYGWVVNRTDRLVAIVLELQARGSLRGEDLAARFEVSVRTIYRDLDALAEAGVPLVATPGKGYTLQDGYFLPPLAFTATEAAVLILGGEFVRERVDDELQRPAGDALHKLSAILPADKRAAVTRWRTEILFPRLRRRADPRLARLRTAIQERRVVRLLYHAFRRPEPELREIEPVSLLYLAERWQVAGYCRLRRGPRLFRLDRIDHLNVLGEQFSPGDRHMLPGWSDAGKSGAAEARVRFDADEERWVRERQPVTFLREEQDADGPVFVYAIQHEQELVRWLLGWGDGVEVLGPASLRARMAAEALAVARRHALPPPPGAELPASLLMRSGS
jgi:predicted DNA-binding transcriptional regulator YafY